jgi:hypothetical protein
MKKQRFTPIEARSKTFTFKTEDQARRAFDQAKRIIEDRYFMDTLNILDVEGLKVTVPEWFPFQPKQCE